MKYIYILFLLLLSNFVSMGQADHFAMVGYIVPCEEQKIVAICGDKTDTTFIDRKYVLNIKKYTGKSDFKTPIKVSVVQIKFGAVLKRKDKEMIASSDIFAKDKATSCPICCASYPYCCLGYKSMCQTMPNCEPPANCLSCYITPVTCQ